MSSAAAFSNQAIGGLFVRNTNVAMLEQMLQHQQVNAPARASAEAPPPTPEPQKGAPEPGKGGHLDVVA